MGMMTLGNAPPTQRKDMWSFQQDQRLSNIENIAEMDLNTSLISNGGTVHGRESRQEQQYRSQTNEKRNTPYFDHNARYKTESALKSQAPAGGLFNVTAQSEKYMSLDIEHLHSLLMNEPEWFNIQNTTKQAFSYLLNIAVQQSNQINTNADVLRKIESHTPEVLDQKLQSFVSMNQFETIQAKIRDFIVESMATFQK